MEEVVAPALLPAARELLRRHEQAGDLVAIVTATNHFVTAPIAHAFGVEHLIAAQPEEDEHGNLTGKLAGTPTQGQGKVEHMHAWLGRLGTPFDSFASSHFYSDSHNDLPRLSVVSHPVATNPSERLKAHASEQGWPLLHLFND